MPDLIQSQHDEDRLLILEALADCQGSAIELAVNANISLAATERALRVLRSKGLVMSFDDGGREIWSRC